jgi:hypothetical protein
MKKVFVYFLLILLSVVIAGFFGIVHDQISYTVSPEYFTKFKFPQFRLADLPLAERTRASIVGFLASWWMGIPIGGIIGAAGFIHHDSKRMLRVSVWALYLSVGLTSLFAICGLLYDFWQTTRIDLSQYHEWFIPQEVADLRRFLCAGYMHNASYLGGAVAIIVACCFQVTMKRRFSRLNEAQEKSV